MAVEGKQMLRGVESRGLLTAACFLFVFASYAQRDLLVGTGVTYCSYIESPGVNFNVACQLVGELYIGSDFSALLTREREVGGAFKKRKELEYNMNAHYKQPVGEKLALYPLCGINLSKITNHDEGFDPITRKVIGLNMGIGSEWETSIGSLFLESKYVTGLQKWDLTLGMVWKLWKD